MLIIHFYLLDNLSLLSRKWPEKRNIFCARVPIIDLRDVLISGASRVFERAILNKRVLTLLNWLVRPFWNILVSVFCSFSFSVCNDQYFPKTHLTLTEQTILTFTLYMIRASTRSRSETYSYGQSSFSNMFLFISRFYLMDTCWGSWGELNVIINLEENTGKKQKLRASVWVQLV